MPFVTRQEPLYKACRHRQAYNLARNTAVGAADVSLMLRDAASEGFKVFGDTNSTERTLTLKAHYDRWLHIIGAFGAELGLKGCLQQLGLFDKERHYTHDLWLLYKEPPKQVRDAMTLKFHRLSNGVGLPGILKKHRNDFVSWRYLDKDPADSSDMTTETYVQLIDTLVDWMDNNPPCSCPERTLNSKAIYGQLLRELRRP